MLAHVVSDGGSIDNVPTTNLGSQMCFVPDCICYFAQSPVSVVLSSYRLDRVPSVLCRPRETAL